MISARSSALMRVHMPISIVVRKHPVQIRSFGSIWQTLTQGVSIPRSIRILPLLLHVAHPVQRTLKDIGSGDVVDKLPPPLT